MKIIAIGHHELVQDNILPMVKAVVPEAETIGFVKSCEALEWLSENTADVVFLDMVMGGINAIDLGKKIKGICPNINIIFIAENRDYLLEALRLHASGYLIKPVSENDLYAELNNLLFPIATPLHTRVRVQTFGNFEIFVDQKPIFIPVLKCRECLAYLVDRKGARVTVVELASLLWEDGPYDKRVQNNTHRIISDTAKYLKEAGIAEIFIRHRGEIAIDTEKIDCDYYEFLKGNDTYINNFHGEYMANYSWGELTLAELVKTKALRNLKK